MEKKVLDEIEKLRNRNEDTINRRMNKIIDENAHIIKMLNKVINPDEDKWSWDLLKAS